MSTLAPAAPPDSQRVVRSPGLPDIERWLGTLLLVAGLIGLGAAFVLAVEKFRLLENPLYLPACSLGEAVNCASVMRSAQSEVFGFPNPFLGIAGFGGLTAAGFSLVGGGRFGRPFWWVLQAGLLLAVGFVHWLIFQTLYRIGALCPFCMAVWSVTIPAFWYVTLHNARGLTAHPGRGGAIAAQAIRYHGVILTAWLLLIAALVFERFWAPWDSIFV